MFTPNPNYSASVPELLTTTPNHADNLNAQVQAILDRLQAAYDELPAIAARQVSLQNTFAALDVAGLDNVLTSIGTETTVLDTQNDGLTARLDAIATTLTSLTTKVSGLTSSANTVETDANGKRLDINIQREDQDLTDIAALSLTASSAIATNSAGTIILATLPNLGIVPPTVYQGGWTLPVGSNSGFTSGQANTWIVVPLTQFYADSGYSTASNRISVSAGIYQVNAQVCGVGCIEIASQLMIWVGATPTLVSEGTIGRTASSGGVIGSSWTVKSYIRDTVELPACQIELQTRFKTAHAVANLTGGMPVSLASQNEDYATITLVKIA